MRFLLAVLLMAACAPVDDAADVRAACALDPIPFDPHGSEIIQGANDDACVRLERTAVPVRRGMEWRATRFLIVTPSLSLDVDDPDALTYISSHHNCMDVAELRTPAPGDRRPGASPGTGDEARATLTIDGTSIDQDACFSQDGTGWLLVLDVDGERFSIVP